MTLPYFCEQADSVLPKLNSSLLMIALAFTFTGSAAVKKVINGDTGEVELLVLLNTEHIQSLYPKGRVHIGRGAQGTVYLISYTVYMFVLPGCRLKESDVCIISVQGPMAYHLHAVNIYTKIQFSAQPFKKILSHTSTFPLYHTQ